MRENQQREIVLLVGARTVESLYMIPALWRLASCPNVAIMPVTAQTADGKPRGADRIAHSTICRTLDADDIVYAAGPPPLVEAVIDIAKASGATCYADAFVPSTGAGGGRAGEGDELVQWRSASASAVDRPIAASPLTPLGALLALDRDAVA